jgi:hypothetical protein
MRDFSRYKRTPTTVYDGELTYSKWKPLTILQKEIDTDDYSAYQVPSEMEGRPDKISNAAYQTPFLDWVLIAYNRVQEPFGWPRANEIIKIPRSQLFLAELIS